MVEYCSTYNSHSVQLAHLPVPSEIKHKIAAKLHDDYTKSGVRATTKSRERKNDTQKN